MDFMFEEALSSLCDISEILEIMTFWCLRCYFRSDCLWLSWFMSVLD